MLAFPALTRLLLSVCMLTGIWGGKGQGKTFQCNLAFKKLAIVPVVMSAGELESGNAGEPAKLIRQRYREASDVIKKVSIHFPASNPFYTCHDCWELSYITTLRARWAARLLHDT